MIQSHLLTAAAERQAQAEQRAQAEYQRQQLRLEEARQAEVREQAAREAEARAWRQQWEADWLDHALKLLPSGVPYSFELDVHHAVAELLRKLDASAAADAIAQLGSEAPLAEIRAAAVEASKKVCVEYDAWKVAENHRKACEDMVGWVFEGEEARDAVRQALEKLPVGSAHTKMENARDAALAPFRAAKKAAVDADIYLLHVSSYVEELGNEEAGEWELGNWSKRYDLEAKLKFKLRPLLIQKLLEKTMGVAEANDFIEDWIDRELELED